MAHVELGNDMPGIRGLLAYRPETAGPLMELAQVLLRGDSTLSAGERELIAAAVSRQNECEYCAASHGASAAALLPGGGEQVEAVLAGPPGDAPVSGKLRALLDIAGLVRADGRLVTDEAVTTARAAGATDREIHDTVLIAAAFCMYNRYVDGLATSVPDDPAQYEISAAHLVAHGYRVLR
ncbi:MAG TPA: peroxidase-related enzyme [Trebonia sp.]